MDDDRGASLDYGDISEEALRGPRIRKRRFKTVAVMLANGERWQVGGPPLGDDDAADAFERGIKAIDDAMLDVTAGLAAKIGMLKAMMTAAYAVLVQGYPQLTFEQFSTLADSQTAQDVVLASINGALPEEQERDLATVTERVAWALDDADKTPGESLAQKVARVVIDGIPVTEAGPAGNVSAPSEPEPATAETG